MTNNRTSAQILVTGGAGFIGSHLCERLLSGGNTIVCLDNLSTGSEENIKPFINNQNFHFIRKDICVPITHNSLPITKLDQIYHLASPASVTYITEHPIEAALPNSVGTLSMLKLAEENNAKLLFASTSEAYGDPLEHPQKESYRGNVNPIGVRSGYDEGKRFGEALCMAYYRVKGVDIKIARIFNTYGPNSDPEDTRVVPQFVTQALRNKPLTVHGDGTQTRSFCYVSDMVAGLVSLMESEETEPVNLGNPIEFRIIDLAEKIIELTGSQSEIKFVSRPKDDPSRRQPDITLAKEKLNWQPEMGLDKGLQDTIDYFRRKLS